MSQQPGERSRLMRGAIWPVATLVLMMSSFAAGRMTGFRGLPEIVGTLPGDESEFSRELDSRIRERFPAGSSEDKLLTYLDKEQFAPEWRRTRWREFEFLHFERAHLPKGCPRALTSRSGRSADGNQRRLREPLPMTNTTDV